MVVNDSTGRWRAPRCGHVKINFDGALDLRLGRGGYGCVARDSNGAVLGSVAGRHEHVTNPEIMEGIAAKKALVWARDMGFSCILVEGDALGLMNKLTTTDHDFSLVGPYVEEAKRAAASFASCRFTHTRRLFNQTAHLLAKFGLGLDTEMCWMEELPTGIPNDVFVSVT